MDLPMRDEEALGMDEAVARRVVMALFLSRPLALLWQKKRFRRCHQQRWKRSEFAQLLEIPRKNVKFCQGSARD
jgi:hypothetical protein